MNWNILKALRKTPYQERAEREKWTTDELVSGGYRPVYNPFLGTYSEGFDRNTEYLFLRPSWAEPARFRMADMGPHFNIAGLYFRPM